jgi:hypothetical protein
MLTAIKLKSDWDQNHQTLSIIHNLSHVVQEYREREKGHRHHHTI